MLVFALSLGGCQLWQRDGVILLLEGSYRASLLGGANDGFAAPDGLVWREGKLYVADEGTSTVTEWSRSAGRRSLADAKLGISTPEDVVAGPDGELFFTDDKSGGVWEVDASGKAFLLAGRERGLASTEGIALSPWGTLMVGETGGNRILEVDRTGAVSVFLGPEHGLSKPESMAFDEQGNLFIADNEDDVLYLRSVDGTLHELVRRDGFSPETITYAGGTLYMTDSKNGKLFRYTAQAGLETIAVFGGRLKRVSGITTDPLGGIYLSVQSGSAGVPGYILHLEKSAAAAHSCGRPGAAACRKA